MSSKIPPLLEPYLALPSEASLILLTNVLGATSNWLILRFLYNTLGAKNDSIDGGEEVKVVFVSFLRDLAFWKEGGKRLGLDLDKVALKKRFTFIDGLSGLFTPKQRSSTAKAGYQVLSSSELASISSHVSAAIEELQSTGGKVLLVVDQIDLLLAAGGSSVGAVELGEILLNWRERAHAVLLSVSADLPLVDAQQTPLEFNHASFLLSLAHEADYTMSLRLLDTGTARDVSGVVRITVGDVEQEARSQIEERELLYFVGGDGGVRVFERGQ